MTHPPSGPTTPTPPPGPKQGAHLYSVASLAQEWECSTRHIYHLISAGELEATDIGRGKAKTRVSEAAAQRYIASRTRRASRGRAAA